MSNIIRGIVSSIAFTLLVVAVFLPWITINVKTLFFEGVLEFSLVRLLIKSADNIIISIFATIYLIALILTSVSIKEVDVSKYAGGLCIFISILWFIFVEAFKTYGLEEYGLETILGEMITIGIGAFLPLISGILLLSTSMKLSKKATNRGDEV